MKLRTEESFEQQGFDEVKQFSIKASPMAFKILSDGLYKDKIGAIVRELSCNAWDSHISAGKEDVKFKLKAPTKVDPFFIIRDYGTGLSEEDVLTLYSTYFESTKSTSNDMIGAFGLGSKTPFSYTTAFDVSSYFNGTRYDFCVFIDTTGLPLITKVGEEPTDEDNGLKITVEAQTKDIDAFDSAIKRYCLTFPNIETNVDLYPFTMVSAFDCGFSIVNSTQFYHDTTSLYVKQGHIIYPLELNRLNVRFNFDIDRHGNNYGKNVILLEAPIGNVSITASREGISYDEETVKFLEEKIVELNEEIVYKTKLIHATIFDDISTDIIEKTLAFQKAIKNMEPLVVSNIILYEDDEDGTVSVRDIQNHHLDGVSCTSIYLSDRYGKRVHKRTHNGYLNISENDVYVVLDKDTQAIPVKHITSYFYVPEHKKIHLSFIKPSKVPPEVFKHAMIMDDFKTLYPAQSITTTSASTGKPVVTGKFSLKTTSWSSYDSYDISDLTGKVFVRHGVKKDDISSLLKILRHLKTTENLVPEDLKNIFILPKKEYDTLSPFMVDFVDLVKTHMDTIIKRYKAFNIGYRQHDSKKFQSLYDFLKSKTKLPLPKYPSRTGYIEAFDYKPSTIRDAFDVLGLKPKQLIDYNKTLKRVEKDFVDKMTNIVDKFPMLKLYDASYSRSQFSYVEVNSMFSDYINQILSYETIKLDETNKEETNVRDIEEIKVS